MITLLMGKRAWIGRLVVGLACLAFAGYRALSNQSGTTTLVAVALGLGLIVSAVWSARELAGESQQVDDSRNKT